MYVNKYMNIEYCIGAFTQRWYCWEQSFVFIDWNLIPERSLTFDGLSKYCWNDIALFYWLLKC